MATDPATIIEPTPAAGAVPAGVDPAVAAAPAAAVVPVAADPATPADPAPKPGGDDWRAEMAGEDKDLMGFLGRFHSKDAALKQFKKMNDDIRKGVYRKPLGADPTEDEMAAYRADFGVPDKPEGYLDKLPDGLVVGDDDRPFIDKFLVAMHGSNAPASVTSAAIDAYYGIVEEQNAAEMEANDNAKRSGEDALRGEWGAEYRRNLNVVGNHLQSLPEEVQGALMEGRGGDGIALMNNPHVLKWLASVALEANPLATVVPGAGANQAQAIGEEIATIENLMRTNRAAYNRDTAKQERLRELYGAREKLGG